MRYIVGGGIERRTSRYICIGNIYSTCTCTWYGRDTYIHRAASHTGHPCGVIKEAHKAIKCKKEDHLCINLLRTTFRGMQTDREDTTSLLDIAIQIHSVRHINGKLDGLLVQRHWNTSRSPHSSTPPPPSPLRPPMILSLPSSAHDTGWSYFKLIIPRPWLEPSVSRSNSISQTHGQLKFNFSRAFSKDKSYI